MAKPMKKGLGRGLDALIPSENKSVAETKTNEEEVTVEPKSVEAEPQIVEKVVEVKKVVEKKCLPVPFLTT